MMADDARRALMRLPQRQPIRLRTYNMVAGVKSRRRGTETTIWLHTIHGDPVTGKEKRLVRQELGLTDADSMEPGEAGESGDTEKFDENDVEVVIDEPARRGMPRAYLEGLSEIEFSARGQLVQEGAVVTRWEIHGTHTGELLGISPTHRDVTFSGMTTVKFDERRGPKGGFLLTATDEWTYWDLQALAEQIGATP